jgi:DNA polymerase-1
MGYKALMQQLLSSSHWAYQFDQVEADDLLGIYSDMFDGVVIASGDKDLKQIPGHHVWLGKGLTYIEEDDAQRFFYSQVLAGDSADGIPGCPTIGEKTAEPIIRALDISDPVGCWETIVSCYAKKGKVAEPDSAALLQARLVRILRGGDYDFTTHTVKLWTPPARAAQSSS